MSDANIQLIVGLGNPGREYEQTRHNAGFWFIDALAQQCHASFKRESKFYGDVAKTTIAGQPVWLLKPDTFMNRSGQAVSALSNFYKIPLQNMLVAHDELDLPPGKVRLKQGGGHGGHNGLRDIMAKHGGGKDFYRLRIGIGHPGDKSQVSGFVLGKAPTSEQELISEAIDKALLHFDWVIEGDMQKAMNRIHG